MTRIAATVAGSLFLLACGGDGGGDAASSNEYSDALATSMKNGSDAIFTDEQIDCLSRERVEILGGTSAFEDAGIAPDELDESFDLAGSGLEIGEAEAEAIARSFQDCEVDLTEAFLDDLAGVPDDVKSCISERVDETVFADILVQELLTTGAADELPEELLNDLLACARAG